MKLLRAGLEGLPRKFVLVFAKGMTSFFLERIVDNPHIEVGERLYRDNAVVLERPDWI